LIMNSYGLFFYFFSTIWFLNLWEHTIPMHVDFEFQYTIIRGCANCNKDQRYMCRIILKPKTITSTRFSTSEHWKRFRVGNITKPTTLLFVLHIHTVVFSCFWNLLRSKPARWKVWYIREQTRNYQSFAYVYKHSQIQCVMWRWFPRHAWLSHECPLRSYVNIILLKEKHWLLYVIYYISV